MNPLPFEAESTRDYFCGPDRFWVEFNLALGSVTSGYQGLLHHLRPPKTPSFPSVLAYLISDMDLFFGAMDDLNRDLPHLESSCQRFARSGYFADPTRFDDLPLLEAFERNRDQAILFLQGVVLSHRSLTGTLRDFSRTPFGRYRFRCPKVPGGPDRRAMRERIKRLEQTVDLLRHLHDRAIPSLGRNLADAIGSGPGDEHEHRERWMGLREISQDLISKGKSVTLLPATVDLVEAFHRVERGYPLVEEGLVPPNPFDGDAW